MRPSPEDLQDRTFFEQSTTLMLYTIAVAISQIANNDKIGQFSASHIVEGEIGFGKKRCENPRAEMEFASMDLARDLFDGKINAVACIGMGAITMKGMISMIDNMNRLLDRVALYLA